MYMDDRTMAVYSLVANYVSSPSLSHLRAERSIAKISHEIVTRLDQKSAVWKKWEGPREELLATALECWIPNEDLLSFFNSLPGPQLTMTDLEQRMKHMIEVDYIGTPEPKLELECLAIYRAEAEAGTEMLTQPLKIQPEVCRILGREDDRCARADLRNNRSSG
jgi:hypothetical protein